MTQQEIQERNKQIALMLGAATKQMMGINAWVLEEDELNLSFDLFDEKLFSNNGGSGWLTKDLKFHKDWNWLMEAVEFIEDKGFPFCVSWNEVTITNLQAFLKQKETGEYDILQPETIIHIYDDEDDKKTLSKKEAVFIAVSDFAKLYNERKL